MPKAVTKQKQVASGTSKKPRAVETAADRRAYLRKIAGWPPLKGN